MNLRRACDLFGLLLRGIILLSVFAPNFEDNCFLVLPDGNHIQNKQGEVEQETHPLYMSFVVVRCLVPLLCGRKNDNG